jgi:integrase
VEEEEKLRKRGNGEGSITRRKNGGWMAQYVVYTATGRKRKTIYGKTRAEVAGKLARAISNREDGFGFDSQNLTVGEYLDSWLTDSVQDTVRLTTYQGYERIVRLHIKPMLERIKLERLTPVHVRGLYRERLEAGLAPRMVQLVHTILHRALKQAVADNFIPRNVTEAVKAPRPERREMKPLNPVQARILLEAARGVKLEALYVLALTTGMRQGEILGLMWEDIDMEAATVQVRRTLSTAMGEGFSFNAPKTSKSRRSIRIPKLALHCLRRRRTSQLEERMKNAGLWEDHDLVFTTRFGTPIARASLITHSFKPLLRRADLPDIRFHDLRHTCATLLLSKGVHVKLVQELLGHSTIAITLDTYSHVLPGMGEGIANTMDEVLS